MKSIAKMSKKDFLLALVKDQVVPALGCTEIGIVSLAGAKAASLLKGEFVSATLYVSNYVYRNDARVGVPKLGRCGIKSIAAAGLLLKNPEKKLACLDDLTPDVIKKALKLGDHMNRAIEVVVEKDSDPVYARVVAVDKFNNMAEVIIMSQHDNIVSASINGKETIKKQAKVAKTETVSWDNYVDKLSIEDAYYLCKKMTLSEIKFIADGINMNQKMVEYGKKHPDKESLIHALNKKRQQDEDAMGFSSTYWMNQVFYDLCAAVDARMYGCPLPVMSSSRSGDHGLTVTIPLRTYAKTHGMDDIYLFQAALFAHFITWKIKSKIGHLSGMCGSAVAAGAAAMAGIGYLRKYDWKKINNLLIMHLTSQSGIMCDGAKPSCTFKIFSSISAGLTALLVVEGEGGLPNMPGVSGKAVESTIESLAHFARRTKTNMVNNVVDILDRMSKCK